MKLLIGLFFTVFISFANDFKDITTFQASFHQSIINNSGNEIIYTGEIYIKYPALILWKYQDPIEKLVYITNTNVTIIEPDLEQAIISTLEKEINIIKLLKDSSLISNNRYKSTLYNTDYILTIDNNIFQKIEYKDELDNKIAITFSNIHQDQTINNDIFKFKIPYEYDIIRK